MRSHMYNTQYEQSSAHFILSIVLLTVQDAKTMHVGIAKKNKHIYNPTKNIPGMNEIRTTIMGFKSRALNATLCNAEGNQTNIQKAKLKIAFFKEPSGAENFGAAKRSRFFSKYCF